MATSKDRTFAEIAKTVGVTEKQVREVAQFLGANKTRGHTHACECGATIGCYVYGCGVAKKITHKVHEKMTR